jgi:hypothetical protein
MPPTAAVVPPPDAWLSLVRRSGAEGRAWADAYRRWEPVAALNPLCLRLLHARRWEEGVEALARFRAEVEGATDADPATRAVLERWYQAVYGYLLYCRDDHAGAERAMVVAGDAVARAVGEVGALLPLVHHCHEFRLHRARIARNQRQWAEMWAHLAEVREMFEGRAPYCLLPDGRAVGLAEVKAYHLALRGLDAAERAAVDSVLDDRARMASLDRFVHALCRLPGFVIPHP